VPPGDNPIAVNKYVKYQNKNNIERSGLAKCEYCHRSDSSENKDNHGDFNLL